MTLPWVRFYAGLWRSACMSLSCDEEGLYSKCCAYMYDTGRPVPADDSAAAKALGVNINKYKKLVAKLIAKGKLIRAQGHIINERVIEEIDRARREREARSAAANRRWEQHRSKLEEIALELEAQRRATPRVTQGVTPPVTPRVTPRVTPPVTPPVTSRVTQGVEIEKINEINGDSGKAAYAEHMLRDEMRLDKTLSQAHIGINITSPRVPARTRGGASPASPDWASALNPEVAAAEQDCRRNPATGLIEVANGFRVELLKLVNGSESDLGQLLSIASGYVGSQIRGPDLKNRVRAKIAELTRGEAQRRKNAELIGKRNGAPATPSKEDAKRRMDALAKGGWNMG